MLGSVPEARGDHLQALVQRPRGQASPPPPTRPRVQGIRPTAGTCPLPGHLPFCVGGGFSATQPSLSQGPLLLWSGDGGQEMQLAQKTQDGSVPRATPHGPGPAAVGRGVLATEGGEWPPQDPRGCWFCVAVFSFVSCLLYKSGGAPVLGARTHVTTTPITESSLTTRRGVRLVVGWFLGAADRRKEVRLASLMGAA